MSSEIWRLGTVGSPLAAQTVLEVNDRLFDLGELLTVAKAGPAPDGGVLEILTAWDDWRPKLAAAADAASDVDGMDVSGISWMPPVVYPGTVVCAGANYRDHLAEMGVDDPQLENPFTFIKPRNTLTGNHRPVEIPVGVEWPDWEGEMAVIIGRRVRNVRGDDARDAIAGYCPFNDLSARDWVETKTLSGTMDMVLHKGFDGFGPMGPLITPAEFVPDAQNLAVELKVNQVVKQSSTTAQMIFSVVEIVEHVSKIMTLEPGDVICTGSPAGVGFGRSPRERLHPGDTVTLTIDGLGPGLVTPIVSAPVPSS